MQCLLPHFEVWPATGCPVHDAPELRLPGDAPGQGWFLLLYYSQGCLINNNGSTPIPVRMAAAEGGIIPPTMDWRSCGSSSAWQQGSLAPNSAHKQWEDIWVRAELGLAGYRPCSLLVLRAPLPLWLSNLLTWPHGSFMLIPVKHLLVLNKTRCPCPCLLSTLLTVLLTKIYWLELLASHPAD